MASIVRTGKDCGVVMLPVAASLDSYVVWSPKDSGEYNKEDTGTIVKYMFWVQEGGPF